MPEEVSGGPRNGNIRASGRWVFGQTVRRNVGLSVAAVCREDRGIRKVGAVGGRAYSRVEFQTECSKRVWERTAEQKSQSGVVSWGIPGGVLAEVSGRVTGDVSGRSVRPTAGKEEANVREVGGRAKSRGLFRPNCRAKCWALCYAKCRGRVSGGPRSRKI